MIFVDTLQMIPQKIAAIFHSKGTLIKADKGMHIFQEGELADHIFLIHNGSIQISKETESGKELTIRICSSNSLIGESLLFCGEQHHSTTAKTLECSKLFSIHNNQFETILNEQPTLLIEFLKWIQTENIKNQSRLRDLVLHGKKGALYSTLIRLANTYGEYRNNNEVHINLALTNTEIANLCATSREMVNRMLTDLRKTNKIKMEKSYITILDLNYLKQEIDCENCPLAICRID
ncbi:Crp/Fnr family transcriptional regulator [Solibacillus sp. FSL K6-1523]|uniref:Crp/Fnr family transcriptional regulator n=2 Tax=Solibacillus sp. FSL K6-1523 TaxID=2921471 RepID=UPI0030FBDF60